MFPTCEPEASSTASTKYCFNKPLLTTFPLSLKRISRLMLYSRKKAYFPNKRGMLQWYNIDAFHNNTLQVHNLNENTKNNKG